MAELVSPLTPTTFEPKKGYNWVIEIDGIDAFTARSTKRPTIGFGTVEVPYLNMTRKFAGKFEFEPIDLVLMDPVDDSAAEKTMDWIRLVGDPATVSKNPAALYKKDFRLKLISGNGIVIETWQILGAWPQSVDFGDLDYGADDPVQISISLNLDRAYLV